MKDALGASINMSSINGVNFTSRSFGCGFGVIQWKDVWVFFCQALKGVEVFKSFIM
jgi:hypothetical protein